MADNDRKTWKDVWERLTAVETQLKMVVDNTKVIPTLVERVKNVEDDCEENKDAHETFLEKFVSSKAFFGWLSALALAVVIITTILFLR